MFKQALATTVLTAGMLIAGAALAQPAPFPATPMSRAHVADGGHVGDGGYVGTGGPPPTMTANYTPVAPDVSTARAAAVTYSYPRASYTGIRIANPTRGDLYTFALNDLYAHGFHRVHDLSLDNGRVQASAVTPNDNRQAVTVNPESGRIMIG